MKNSSKIIGLAFLLFCNSLSYAQIISPNRIKNRIINRAGDKAEQRVGQEIDKSVDKGIDKAFDSLFGNTQKTDSKESEKTTSRKSDSTISSQSMTETEALNRLGGFLNSVNSAPAPAASYSFSSSYVMHIKSKNKNGKEDYEMKNRYYFTKSGQYMGTKVLEGSDPRGSGNINALEAIVIDFEKDGIYTFMNSDGKKSMISVSLNSAGNLANSAANLEKETSSFTKTGKTKTISGYICDGYLNKRGDDEGIIWISRSRVPVVSTYYESFQKMSSSGKNNFKIDNDVNAEMMKIMKEGRAMLGMDNTNDNGDEMTMEVIDIKESDSFTISTTGYENMMDFNKMMEDAKKKQAEER